MASSQPSVERVFLGCGVVFAQRERQSEPSLEPTSSAPVPRERDFHFPNSYRQTRTLHAHPDQQGVLIEATRDGDDFIRVCGLHQYCSPPTPGHAPACPFCICEAEEWRGRKRYAALHGDGVRIVGDWC